jgi:GRAM domain-containing protein
MLIAPIALEPGEKLMAEAHANLWRGCDAVGGKLYITDRRMRFESHPFNFQFGPTEILMSEVKAVSRVNNLRLVPNGLLVETKKRTSYRFVVWNRQPLIGLIQMAVAKAQGDGQQASDGFDASPPDRGVWDRELDGNA